MRSTTGAPNLEGAPLRLGPIPEVFAKMDVPASQRPQKAHVPAYVPCPKTAQLVSVPVRSNIAVELAEGSLQSPVAAVQPEFSGSCGSQRISCPNCQSNLKISVSVQELKPAIVPQYVLLQEPFKNQVYIPLAQTAQVPVLILPGLSEDQNPQYTQASPPPQTTFAEVAPEKRQASSLHSERQNPISKILNKPPPAPSAASETQAAREKYPCSQCNKTYLSKRHLSRHSLRHTGERPFQCLLCSETFARSDIAKRHCLKCGDRQGQQTANFVRRW